MSALFDRITVAALDAARARQAEEVEGGGVRGLVDVDGRTVLVGDVPSPLRWGKTHRHVVHTETVDQMLGVEPRSAWTVGSYPSDALVFTVQSFLTYAANGVSTGVAALFADPLPGTTLHGGTLQKLAPFVVSREVLTRRVFTSTPERLRQLATEPQPGLSAAAAAVYGMVVRSSRLVAGGATREAWVLPPKTTAYLDAVAAGDVPVDEVVERVWRTAEHAKTTMPDSPLLDRPEWSVLDAATRSISLSVLEAELGARVTYL